VLKLKGVGLTADWGELAALVREDWSDVDDSGSRPELVLSIPAYERFIIVTQDLWFGNNPPLHLS